MISHRQGAGTSQSALEETVVQLVATALGKKPRNVKIDEPLLSHQTGFDSFSLMELVLRLEDTFGISIPDEHLDPDVFHSVKTIASYLYVRLEQRD